MRTTLVSIDITLWGCSVSLTVDTVRHIGVCADIGISSPIKRP
jgi:hypothetical protein